MRVENFNDSAKIRIIKDRNVREGMLAAPIWNTVEDGMKVATFVAKRSKAKSENPMGELKWLFRSGNISVDGKSIDGVRKAKPAAKVKEVVSRDGKVAQKLNKAGKPVGKIKLRKVAKVNDKELKAKAKLKARLAA